MMRPPHQKPFSTDEANAWFFDDHLLMGTPCGFRFYPLLGSPYSLYQFATPRDRFASGARYEMVTIVSMRRTTSPTSSGVIDYTQVLRSWASLILKGASLCTNGWLKRCLSSHLSHLARSFVVMVPHQNRLALLQRLSCAPDDVLCLSIDWSNRRYPTKWGQAFLTEIIHG